MTTCRHSPRPWESGLKEFKGRLAVVTGCGSGIGRELTRQLAAAGVRVAGCDLMAEALQETVDLVKREFPHARVTGHSCDVGMEGDIAKFREDVASSHDAECVHLLFNNAAIGGCGSFVRASRKHWERTFTVCWNGVYWCTREFLPLLMAADEARIVNVSSVNGFWASLGPDSPNTAYSAAKFAVKGFSEALITDLRLNAPHVGVSVVMPGHIRTPIVSNSMRVLYGTDELDWSDSELEEFREQWKRLGIEVGTWSLDQVRGHLQDRLKKFEESAPTSASQAARVILDGVQEGRWRILVGEDAHHLDQRVRTAPDRAYDIDFLGPRVTGPRTPFLR